METILLILVVGFICLLCFYTGAKIGQKVARGETIELDIKTPVEAYEEHKEKEEQKREQEKLQIISDNIDSYDGTGIGQKDIPNT